jgi:hypothetical protein
MSNIGIFLRKLSIVKKSNTLYFCTSNLASVLYPFNRVDEAFIWV